MRDADAPLRRLYLSQSAAHMSREKQVYCCAKRYIGGPKGSVQPTDQLHLLILCNYYSKYDAQKDISIQGHL